MRRRNSTAKGRKEQEKQKRDRESTNVMRMCARHVNDTEKSKECWIGCDERGRWYHYWCAGLVCMPNQQWICPACKEEED